MYEIEYKVEISAAEREALLASFKEKGFPATRVTPQNDFYVEAKDSPVYKGYDIKRYRDEGGKIIYTQKTWEMIGDQPARKEIEHEVPREVFEAEIAKFPEAKKIKKTREWFNGSHGELPISITIDTVKFDHSPAVRYFIEAETQSKNKEDVKELKGKIQEFLKDILGKDELVESPGMFMMVLNKI